MSELAGEVLQVVASSKQQAGQLPAQERDRPPARVKPDQAGPPRKTAKADPLSWLTERSDAVDAAAAKSGGEGTAPPAVTQGASGYVEGAALPADAPAAGAQEAGTVLGGAAAAAEPHQVPASVALPTPGTEPVQARRAVAPLRGPGRATVGAKTGRPSPLGALLGSAVGRVLSRTADAAEEPARAAPSTGMAQQTGRAEEHIGLTRERPMTAAASPDPGNETGSPASKAAAPVAGSGVSAAAGILSAEMPQASEAEPAQCRGATKLVPKPVQAINAGAASPHGSLLRSPGASVLAPKASSGVSTGGPAATLAANKGTLPRGGSRMGSLLSGPSRGSQMTASVGLPTALETDSGAAAATNGLSSSTGPAPAVKARRPSGLGQMLAKERPLAGVSRGTGLPHQGAGQGATHVLASASMTVAQVQAQFVLPFVLSTEGQKEGLDGRQPAAGAAAAPAGAASAAHMAQQTGAGVRCLSQTPSQLCGTFACHTNLSEGLVGAQRKAVACTSILSVQVWWTQRGRRRSSSKQSRMTPLWICGPQVPPMCGGWSSSTGAKTRSRCLLRRRMVPQAAALTAAVSMVTPC